MSSNISKSVKRKRVNLSVVKKLQVIKDIEKGATVKSVYEKYGEKGRRSRTLERTRKSLKNLHPHTVLMPRLLRVVKLGQKAHENREGGAILTKTYIVHLHYVKSVSF